MKHGWLTALALIAAGASLALLLQIEASAQADEIEAAIGQARSGASMRELQAQASAEPPKTDDRHELAIFYHKRGMANYRLGNYHRAVDDLRLALENNDPNRLTAEGWGARWRMQNDLGNSHESLGDWFSAIDHWNAVLREYRESNLWRYHFGQLRLINAFTRFAKWEEANRAREEAENALSRLRSSRGWAVDGFNALDQHDRWTAAFFSRQGNYAEAERRFRASLESAQKYLELKQRTLPGGHQTIRIAVGNVGSAKRWLAENLAIQGKYGEAEVLARAGLQDALAYYGFNTTAASWALDVVGRSRFQQGDVAGAERFYRYALAAIEGSGVAPHSTSLAARRSALASALLVQGRWNEALKVYEERDQGLRSNAAQFKQFGSRSVGWAYTLHKTGDSPRAAEMVRRLIASQLKRPVPNRWYIAQLRGVLGMALAGSGRTAEALDAFRESIPELVRRDQDDASSENTGFWRAFWQRVLLEGYLDLLAKLHGSGETVSGVDIVDESFRIADMARGSGVQEAINATAARAQLPDQGLAELARKEQDGLNRVVALNQLLGRLASAPAEERLNKVIADMRAEIERLRKEHAALRADIRKRYPEYAELIDPRPAGIADVRKALMPGEGLVSIYLGDSRSYVWAIGGAGKVAFRVVPVKREEVEREVSELRKAVDFGDGSPARLRAYDLARAYKLYRTLLEPEEAVWKDAQVLNVIPHGALGQLPFAMLVTAVPSRQPPAGAQAGYGEAPWLLRRIAVVQLPSGSAFAALRRAPSGKPGREPFIGFGDPVFTPDSAAAGQGGVVRNLVVRKATDGMEGQLSAMVRSGKAPAAVTPAAAPTLSGAFSVLSALPDTSDELKEIAAVLKADPARDVFVSRQATEKNVKQAALQSRRVVAFATHGITPGELVGLDQPALAMSNPALSGDADNDGFLTMEEVLGLKLDADWVVLSACNTASADGRGGEAVSGLGRAFFYAGARSLLVSNWAVETSSARLLTTGIFKRQSEDPGLTRAEALRQSMLDLMGRKASGGFSYAHPAFWAPFSLVGDGGR